jgi:hypothetical protein
MLKHILAASLTIVSFAFANDCRDWSNNSDNCLIDTVSTIPRFANTEETMTVGSTACMTYDDKYYTVKDSVGQTNGLVVKFKLPRRICRKIVDITFIKIPHTRHISKKKIDRSCCIRQACVGCSPDFIRNEIDQCYHGEWHAAVCSRIYYIDSTYYTHAYQITYSDSADITYEYSIEKTQIELSPEYFVDGNIIEIYRDDGTIKYKGELIFVPGDKENFPSYKTRGWCYNKTGTKETRKTNNVSLCK